MSVWSVIVNAASSAAPGATIGAAIPAVLVGLLALLAIAALVDGARFKREEWVLARQDGTHFLVLTAPFSLCLCGAGGFVGGYYFLAVRPKLMAVRTGGLDAESVEAASGPLTVPGPMAEAVKDQLDVAERDGLIEVTVRVSEHFRGVGDPWGHDLDAIVGYAQSRGWVTRNVSESGAPGARHAFIAMQRSPQSASTRIPGAVQPPPTPAVTPGARVTFDPVPEGTDRRLEAIRRALDEVGSPRRQGDPFLPDRGYTYARIAVEHFLPDSHLRRDVCRDQAKAVLSLLQVKQIDFDDIDEAMGVTEAAYRSYKIPPREWEQGGDRIDNAKWLVRDLAVGQGEYLGRWQRDDHFVSAALGVLLVLRMRLGH